MNLKDTQTLDNLKAAFSGESQANSRYLNFAAEADDEGWNNVAALFRSTAEGKTGRARAPRIPRAGGRPCDQPNDQANARKS